VVVFIIVNFFEEPSEYFITHGYANKAHKQAEMSFILGLDEL